MIVLVIHSVYSRCAFDPCCETLDDVKSHVHWETPRGRYEAVQQQVFPQYETKVIEPVGVGALQKVVGGGIWHGATPGNPATDVEPAHNTIKLLCANETGRLSIFPACCNKGVNVWCGK